jgi:hypothetical protein
MKDPVTLPSSRAIVDSTTKSHLLPDSKDPFSRAPLKIEEVTPGAYSPVTSFECFELTPCSVIFVDTEFNTRIYKFLAAEHTEKRVQKMDTD